MIEDAAPPLTSRRATRRPRDDRAAAPYEPAPRDAIAPPADEPAPTPRPREEVAARRRPARRRAGAARDAVQERRRPKRPRRTLPSHRREAGTHPLEKILRDEAPSNGRGRDDEISREDVIHQPTVEYTPFQTEEHACRGAARRPRDDEPRLVAARNIQREDHDADGEIHAYATKASHGDTAEHDLEFDTGEHHAPEETERRAPAPLRSAPNRPPDAPAARRRPAPNAPRGRGRRSRPPKTPKGPRPGGGAHWGRRIFALLAMVVIVGVLYVANATFQPFHGDGEGNGRGHDPRELRRGGGRQAARREGRDRLGALLRAQGDARRRPGRPAPGRVHAQEGHDQRRRDQRAHDGAGGPAGGPDGERDAGRRPVAQGERAGRRRLQQGRGQLRASRAPPRPRSDASASSARPRAPRPPRASCSRRPTS